MSHDMDLDTLTVRYIPCHPLEDGLGFCDVAWRVTLFDGTAATMRLRAPLILHHGVLRYEEVLDLPIAVILAVAEVYQAWAATREATP